MPRVGGKSMRATWASLVVVAAIATSACGKKDGGASTGVAPATSAPATGTAPATGAPATSAPAPEPPPVPNPADGWSSDKRAQVLVQAIDRRADGSIELEVDVRDGEGKPVASLDPAAIALSIDGRYVPGKYEVKGFREAGRGAGIAFLVPTHYSYSAPIDPDSGITTSPLDGIKQGVAGTLGKLRDNDRVIVVAYDEEGTRLVTPWGGAAGAVALVGEIKGAEGGKQTAPAFFSAVRKAFDLIAEDEANQPARRIVVTVSDGLDRLADNARAHERLATEIAERAAEIGAELWALGYTLAMPEPLVSLDALTSKTGGRYRSLAAEGYADLGKSVEALVSEIDRSFVVSFTPDRPVTTPVVKLEVALKLPDGAVGRRVVEGVKLGR